MKKTLITFFCCLAIGIFAQQNKKEKIGVIFNINGPHKIYKNAGTSNTWDDKNLSPDDPFYELIQFLGTEKADMLRPVKENFLQEFKNKGYEPKYLNEDINEKNFSKFKGGGFRFDVRNLKEKYGVDKVLIAMGEYGLEIEKFFGANADKRTNISFTTYLIDLKSNKIENYFSIFKYQNIRKKDLMNPPNYPNVVESIQKLNNDKVLPTLNKKIKELEMSSDR